MIREEIEKLRGYVFTEEELNEIIKPAVIASECKINIATTKQCRELRK